MIGFNDLLTKLFGNKSQRDLKEITPWVDKIKAVYPSIQQLSNDELRARVDAIKQRIQDAVAEEKAKAKELRDSIEKTEIEERESIWAEVDKIEKVILDKMEVKLNEELPEAFAIMKDTARRFAENEEVVVTATPFDRELAPRHDFVRIEGDKVTISWKEQAYLDSLTFMQKLRFTLGVACPDNNYGATNFKNGDVAMTMGTFEFVWASASQMDQESIGCAPLPAGPNFEADGSRYSCMTNLLGIVNGSKNPNGAAEFCRIMNQNDKTKYPDGTPIGNPEAEKYLSAEHKEVLRFVRDNAYVVMTDGWGSWGEQDGNSLWVNLFWDNKDIVKTLDSLQPIYQAQIDETLSFSMPEVEEFKGAPTVTFENGDMAYLTFDGTVSKDQGITDEADRVIDGKSSLVFSSDTKDALLLRSSASKLKIPSYRTYKLSFDWQIISAQDAVNGCDFYATFRSEAEVNSADRQTGALSFGGVAGDFGTAEATVTLSANIKDYVVAFVAGLNGGTVAIDNVSLVEVE